MTIKKIFIAGAGLMGGGISQVCAQAGFDVTMRDLSEDILPKGKQDRYGRVNIIGTFLFRARLN